MRLLRAAACVSAGVLLAYTARRAALLLAALARPAPPRAANDAAEPAAVLLLIPCRNEAASLPGLFAALDALDYPRERLTAVIVDDGSTDATRAASEAWAQARPWARCLSLPHNAGKAQALNAALAGAGSPPSYQEGGAEGGRSADIIIVYDADHRPRPASLRALAAAFADPRVGGASGQMRVANGDRSPAAAYAAIESLVNQFITMQGKDRLDLAPALLGSNCAYRRGALEAAGGFARGALLEDSDLSVRLAAAGWRTRFVPASISDHHAPLSVRGYVRQHLRWNRGFQQVAGGRLWAVWANPRLSLPLKLELTFFALGYADRLALIAGGLCTLADLIRPGAFKFPRAVWAAYFGVPAAEMVAALVLAGEPPRAFARLGVVPFFFLLDLGIAAWSALAGVLRRPARWTETERAWSEERRA
jgi:cellulose synthase/poly-beta-1,6-N-acetylglucosamine synthase-like glycosyltransferase